MYPQSSQNFSCPPNALAWAQKLLNEPIVDMQQLKGSTSAVLFNLTTTSGRQAVLRLFTLKSWLKVEPDLARHEAAVLKQMENGGAITPICLGFDEFGEETTHPAILMTKLPGAVDISPTNLSDWIEQQAKALAQIHLTPVDGFKWQYKDWFDYAKISVPAWTDKPDIWSTLLEHLKEAPAPVYKPVFMHRDYHPTNVLWQDGKISGVVDWVNGCTGPAMIDVAHCRLNLASLFGAQTADEFLHAWLAEVGQDQYSVWWDICGLANGDLFSSDELFIYRGWGDFGRNDINLETLAKNLNAHALNISRLLKNNTL